MLPKFLELAKLVQEHFVGEVSFICIDMLINHQACSDSCLGVFPSCGDVIHFVTLLTQAMT